MFSVPGSPSELGFAVVPFHPFLGEGSPTDIYRLQKERVPTYSNLSNLEDLEDVPLGISPPEIGRGSKPL